MRICRLRACWLPALLVWGLIFACQVSAANIQTEGKWGNIQPDDILLLNFNAVTGFPADAAFVNWGKVPEDSPPIPQIPGNQSGYVYEGIDTAFNLPPNIGDSETLVIGTFTHRNQPLDGDNPSLESADLTVTVQFGAFKDDIVFMFEHEETKNIQAECLGDDPPCDDFVSVLQPTFDDWILELNGGYYRVEFVGFVLEDGTLLEGRNPTVEGTQVPAYLEVKLTKVLPDAIKVTKEPDEPVVHAGDTVTYTYRATNAGFNPLGSVTITDDKCSPVSFQGGDSNNNQRLEVGEIWLYTCATTISEDTDNITTVTGQPLDPDTGKPLDVDPVEDTGTAHVNVIDPAIKLEKQVDKPVIEAGEKVTYTYRVSNDGDQSLTNIVLTDDTCSSPVFKGGDSNNDQKLDLNETWRYECSMVLTQTTTNKATVTGKDSLGGTVQDTATQKVKVVDTEIQLIKTVDKPFIFAGETVTYTYRVKPPADQILFDIKLTDDKCGTPVFDISSDNGNGLLEPGETWRYTCEIALFQDTLNTAVVTGKTYPDGVPVTDTDTAQVKIKDTPDIHLNKTVDKAEIKEGETVTYQYLVTTTQGFFPIEIISITDDTCAPLLPVDPAGDDSNGNGLLDLGETWRYSCSVTLYSTTTNTAVVKGKTSPGGIPVTDSDSAKVTVKPTPPPIPTPARIPVLSPPALGLLFAFLIVAGLRSRR